MSSTSAPASTADAHAKVPLLATVSGNGGASYASWRPQMKSFLMRQGVEERDYTRELPQWETLAALLAKNEQDAEQAAFDAVLSGFSGGDSSAVKAEPLVHKKDDQARLAEFAMSRSRKAYGYLYASLPAELRLLVADVPQGYAYGLWSFLEKKFRNTEQDSVLALWKELTTMKQSEEESFDEYKARVDSVKELLTHAKQKVEPALYASLLLWNLSPRYSTVVLSLKTGERLKKVEEINWSEICALIADFERAHSGLVHTDPSVDRGLAARGMATNRSHVGSQDNRGNRGNRQGDRANNDSTCYRCGRTGHRAADCYSRRHKDGSALPESTKKGGQDKSSSQRSGKKPTSRGAEPEEERSNYGQAETTTDEQREEDDDAAPQTSRRSYSAIVLSGLARSMNTQSSGQRYSNGSKTVLPSEMRMAFSGSSQSPATAATVSSTSSRSSTNSPPKASPAAPKQSKIPLDTLLRTKGKAIDTGATAHMTGNRESLDNFKRCVPMPIKMADGNIILAQHKGELSMRLAVESEDGEGKHVRVKIPDVYYHERFDTNLLSWGLMREGGWTLKSGKTGTVLGTPGGNKIIASTRGRLTIIEDMAMERALSAQSGKPILDSNGLIAAHRRLGHMSWSRLIELCKSKAVVGITSLDKLSEKELELAKKKIQECEACVKGKSTRTAIGDRGLDKGQRPGEVINMDTFYITRRDASTGKKITEYCMIATDGFSEWRWTEVVKGMSELSDSAVAILRHCKATTNQSVRMIITDLGSEFDNKKLQQYCSDNGIKMQPSPPRVKELNGLAEKSVDTVKNHVRSMLHAAGITNGSEYSNAILHHTYLWNRTHIGQRTGKTPYEAMISRVASVARVGEFGCDTFVNQHRSQRDTTFSSKAEAGIYLGHDGKYNCAKVRMLSTGKIVLAKDVIFREGSFVHLATLLKGREGDSSVITIVDPTPHLSLLPDINEETDSVGDELKENDSENEGQYEVEEIRQSRTRHGVRQYLTKWVGYDKATWEPASVIEEDAPEAAKQFQHRSSGPETGQLIRRSERLKSDNSSASSSITDNTENDNSTNSALGLAATQAAWCL